MSRPQTHSLFFLRFFSGSQVVWKRKHHFLWQRVSSPVFLKAQRAQRSCTMHKGVQPNVFYEWGEKRAAGKAILRVPVKLLYTPGSEKSFISPDWQGSWDCSGSHCRLAKTHPILSLEERYFKNKIPRGCAMEYKSGQN